MIQASLKSIPAWQSHHVSTNPLAGTTSTLMQGNASGSISSMHTLQALDNSSSVEWILDSGATDHITCQLHKLINPIPMQASLYLPDGTNTAITHCGSVQLTNDILLQQVLCVPNFRCNLISISKLTANSVKHNVTKM